MKTTNIKGKEYVEVSERIKHFREHFKKWSLISEILKNDDGVCVIKAIIATPEGKIVATGHAYEKENSTYINKTSYIENCETSAWGRALGNLGIGIDAGIASKEEVVQKELPTPTENQWLGIVDKFKAKKITLKQVEENFSLSADQKNLLK